MEVISDLNLKATELRLGLPGSDEREQEMASSAKNNKRASPETAKESSSNGLPTAKSRDHETAPKAQIVGWPPVKSYRKNNIQPRKPESESGMYVKVSMDGAPYLRKIDLKLYDGYPELLSALETMFKLSIGEYSEREGYKGSEYAPAYEDKDGDLMLVGDVPWDMFMSTCKRLRIMKGADARGWVELSEVRLCEREKIERREKMMSQAWVVEAPYLDFEVASLF